MRPLVFLDLDDTLFHSSRKCAPGDGAAVAFGRDGQPLSFMSQRQRAFFDWLARDAQVVPTTGRNRDAYRRVRLPFAGYAICSHGGLVIAPDGDAEPRWHARMQAAAAEYRAPLAELLARAQSLARDESCDVRARIIGEGDLELYLSIKHNLEDAAALGRWAPRVLELLPPGWKLLLNDNNLAVLPPFLGKESAVAWFIEELAEPGSFVIGVGDSLSDFAFMARCDYAMAPTNSQLFSGLVPP